jgi:glutamate synthase (NADPH/NADH) small chain
MKNVSVRVTMPKQASEDRRCNFNEVALGYSPEMAAIEAERCLECKSRPCQKMCPVNIKIPEFIHLIKEGKFEEAYLKILEDSTLPAICGRVCPQEDQCEKTCVRAAKGESVSIGALERFVADWYMSNREMKPAEIKRNGHKVAVVGSGPAGLACATDLAKQGFEVCMLEALQKPGGVLSYGIPEFRLPKDLVKDEIKNLEKLGVEIVCNVLVGRSITIEDLFENGFGAVFVGSGAGNPAFMGIPGENFNGVFAANEYLTRSNLMKAYDTNTPTPIKRSGKVAVIGAGNVAMDAARTAVRLGADEVTIVYRRGREEMPARHEEIENAEEEGVKLMLLTAPVEVIGTNYRVSGLRCQRMELGEPDASGRRRPCPIEGSEVILNVDTVVVAVGQTPNQLIRMTTPGLETKSWGGIVVDEITMESSIAGVYAGGDAVTGAATVILAMGAGKAAAAAIAEKLLAPKDE